MNRAAGAAGGGTPTADPGFTIVRGRDILLRVKAKPGARADRVAGIRADALLVEVRAAPERGRANEAIARVLAGALGITASAVVLKSGAAAPAKTFVLPLAARAALQRLGKELA